MSTLAARTMIGVALAVSTLTGFVGAATECVALDDPQGDVYSGIYGAENSLDITQIDLGLADSRLTVGFSISGGREQTTLARRWHFAWRTDGLDQYVYAERSAFGDTFGYGTGEGTGAAEGLIDIAAGRVTVRVPANVFGLAVGDRLTDVYGTAAFQPNGGTLLGGDTTIDRGFRSIQLGTC